MYRYDGQYFNIPVSMFKYLVWTIACGCNIVPDRQVCALGDRCCFPPQAEDLPVGLFPVDRVRDPRICRLWSKCNLTDFKVATFTVGWP